MARLSRLPIFAIVLLCLTLLLGSGGTASQAYAQSAPAQDVGAMLDKTQSSVTNIQERLKQKPQDIDDTGLVAIRDTLQEAQTVADDIVVKLEPELASVEARLKELGVPTVEAEEPADIAQQRAQLKKRQALLDSQIKLAKLMGVDARQGQDQISLLRRARFQAELGTRSQSLLVPSFWRDVARDAPRDMRRLNGLLKQLGANLKAVPTHVWSLALGMALLLLIVGETGRRGLGAFTVKHTKPARLRRSIFAFLTVVLYTIVPGLLATIMLFVMRWNGGLDQALNSFLEQSAALVYVAGFVAGLGMVLLSPARPSWRLPALSDGLARRLAWVPLVFAVTIVLAWLAQRALDLINATLSTTLLVNGIMTVLLNVLIGFTALSLRSSHQHKQGQSAQVDGPSMGSSMAAWVRAIPSVLVVVVSASLAAFLLGFIALSSLVAQEIIWLTLVVSTAYLLVVLVTDVFDSLVARVEQEQAADLLAAQQARTRCQVLVLVSGALRLMLILFAIALVLLPFGEDPGDWLRRRLGFLLVGFQIGEAQIRPASIAVTLVVLLVGAYSVRVMRSWISDQFLPVTRLDESMRTSAANLLGYLGYFAVIMIAVSSLGIGLERMAS
ncbi:DUF3772 domain-containing protein [Alcaligenaceae bacterium]|nr:DUF3772 domain-containing protein [Alcaligenaceae bacterium]